MKKTVLTFLSAVLSVYCLSADEGMWLINTIDMALEKKMRERGLELPAGEIYNADAPGAALSDAVVSRVRMHREHHLFRRPDDNQPPLCIFRCL